MRHLTTMEPALVLFASPAVAQEAETVEELAFEEQVQAVQKAIAAFNCTAPAVEKESDTLLGIDDAACGTAASSTASWMANTPSSA